MAMVVVNGEFAQKRNLPGHEVIEQEEGGIWIWCDIFLRRRRGRMTMMMMNGNDGNTKCMRETRMYEVYRDIIERLELNIRKDSSHKRFYSTQTPPPERVLSLFHPIFT